MILCSGYPLPGTLFSCNSTAAHCKQRPDTRRMLGLCCRCSRNSFSPSGALEPEKKYQAPPVAVAMEAAHTTKRCACAQRANPSRGSRYVELRHQPPLRNLCKLKPYQSSANTKSGLKASRTSAFIVLQQVGRLAITSASELYHSTSLFSNSDITCAKSASVQA